MASGVKLRPAASPRREVRGRPRRQGGHQQGDVEDRRHGGGALLRDPPSVTAAAFDHYAKTGKGAPGDGPAAGRVPRAEQAHQLAAHHRGRRGGGCSMLALLLRRRD